MTSKNVRDLFHSLGRPALVTGSNSGIGQAINTLHYDEEPCMITSLLFALAASTLQASAHPQLPPAAAAYACGSQALKRAANEQVTIAYRTVGKRGGAPVLLLAGSGMQLIDWPEPFVQELANSGHYVILADPRDGGCSSKLEQLGLPDWPHIFQHLGAGNTPNTPYTAEDMVGDALAVLRTEHIKAAHVVGASGGAIVAEVMAINHPERVLSLTLVGSNAGNPSRAIPAKPDVIAAVGPPPSPAAPRDKIVAYLSSMEAALSLQKDPQALPSLRARANERVVRGYSFDGVQRQGAAFLAAGDLRSKLGSVRVPATVIHGADDPLIPPQAGRDVADAITNARYIVVPGSGHALDRKILAAALSAIKSQAQGGKPK